ncbi:MAG: peptidylprolyl isomerase [Burkholderiaceae bacterium]|jgi:peptidyl-prolyl cis-trans isomerase C|nr:peptidylprolyl isomerase [Burkholderiaceae bacterium]
MKKQITAAATAALLAFTALPVLAQNVAVVNGKPIPQARFDVLKDQIQQQAARMGTPLPPDIDKKLHDELVANEIFAQEADREGIAATPAFRNQLDWMRQAVLIKALFDNYLKQHPVSDADAKTEYDRLVKQMASQASGKEYKVSHILVPTEDQAKDIIAQIKKGAKFSDLAKKYSKDPGSATNGGELGWADPKTYVPEFAGALTKLDKGQMTDTPVKTQYGYHIIRVEDIRDSKPPVPPPFDAVKPRIVQQLEGQKIVDFQKSLQAKAKIQ